MSANWVIPPGYRGLEDTLKEYGRDRAETNLASERWLAFAFDPYTGDLQRIPATTWCAEIGRKWLDEGSSVRFEKSETGISHYVIIVWTGQQPPTDEEGWAVHLAKELMAAAFPQGEWRQMGIRAVRKGCEREAKKRQVPLPSPDSFSRAMGRRRK